HDFGAAAAFSLVPNCLDEQRPDAGVLVKGVYGDDLENARADVIGEQSRDAARAFGDETGQGGRIEGGVVHDDLGGTPELGRQPADGRPVTVLNGPDDHLLLLHRTIIPGAGTAYPRLTPGLPPAPVPPRQSPEPGDARDPLCRGLQVAP